VVNRSEIVGRPLAALLANDGAKVYSVDITGVQQYHRGAGIKLRKHQVQDTTLKLEDVAPLSDIIITGVPSSSYKFPSELIRDGAICINFSSDKNFDNAGVKEHAGIYVPAIGKVTIAMLLRNLYGRQGILANGRLRLYDNRQKDEQLEKVQSSQ
jgi:methylenetetrahydrofolate dehydrogenase (NAD+)